MTSDDGHRHDPDQFDNFEEEEEEVDDAQEPPDGAYVPDPYHHERFPQYDDGKPMPGSQLTETEDPTQPRQVVTPPSWVVQQLYSLWFYVAVMCSVAALTWWGWISVGSPTALRGVAIGVTVLAAFQCLLRIVRGSVIESRRRFEEDLRNKAHKAKSTSAGGFPVITLVSNRVGQCLDRTPGKPPEVVLWESKQHWASIFSLGALRFAKDGRRRKASGWFFGIFAFLIVASIFYSHQGDPAGVVGRINSIIGLFSLVIISYTMYGVWEWQVNRYAITSKRLLGITGVFRKDVGSMPNNRFTDAKISTSTTAYVFEWLRWVDRAWSTWDVESAGQDQALKIIRFVPDGDIIGPFYSLGSTQ